MDINNDTIAAISTPMGTGGIGIVRLSGRDAISIADKIFYPLKRGKLSEYSSHTVHYGHIKNNKEEIVDEVLLTVMLKPKTYTTEDIVEINCHGGNMSLRKVLDLCLFEGARLAEPGEFTKKAFLNGRIDLSQAEAVLDIIKAETDIAEKIAAGHLKGDFSCKIKALRNSIIELLSFVELSIDFSQEDVDFVSSGTITEKIDIILENIKELIATSKKGIILREGSSVVICGRPNVGKSSLMNALLRHDRVIVTPVAGTTRDIIEECINIGGAKIKLSDTAGIIETQDRVEMEGIRRSREKLADADVVVFLLDSNKPLSKKESEIFDIIKTKKVVIAANKMDLTKKLDIKKAKELFGVEKIIKVSALRKTGLEKLEDAIEEKIFDNDLKMPEGVIVTNIRHKEILQTACDALERAKNNVKREFNGELLASDLNEVVYCLGLVIGENIEDDILDRIFSQFCIGK